MIIEENVPLADLTTFRLGGPAHFFVRVATYDDLKTALAYAKIHSLQTLILGGGSNLLVSDIGFNGLVIKIEFLGVAIVYDGDTAIIVASAGENWDALVARAVAEGLWGIENLSGIPGTVGAAPVQNIGAYGVELKDRFLWAEVLDTHTGEIVRFEQTQCSFAYRMSQFKRTPHRYVILRVALGLSVEASPILDYKDLAEVYRGNTHPTLSEIRETVLAIRARKFPDVTQEGTAGSFFLNPVVTPTVAMRLSGEYPGLPQYQTPEGVKLSLAWLLDRVLNLRGFTVGGARLFEKQPLVVVASRTALPHDVEALVQEVIDKVQTVFAINIEPEVRIIK